MRKHAGLLAQIRRRSRDLILDSPDLAPYTPESAAEAMASVVKQHEPWGLFLSASERGRDWGPRLAARLGLGLTGDAIGLEIDAQNRLVALKPAFGGNIVAPIFSRTLPQMATVRSGVLELADPNEGRTAEVEVVHPHVSKPLSRLVKEHSLLDTTIEPMEGAEVIVGSRHRRRRSRGRRGGEGFRADVARGNVCDAAGDRCGMDAASDSGWTYG